MFMAGDSGFSELTSIASEDENVNVDMPSTRYLSFTLFFIFNVIINILLCFYSHSHQLPRDQDMEGTVGSMSMFPMEKDDEDDNSSDTSDVSDISGLSDLSNHDWEPSSGTMTWVQQQMMMGANPRTILTELVPNEATIPSHLDDVTLWKVSIPTFYCLNHTNNIIFCSYQIIVNIVSEPPRRERLRHINSITDAVRLLRTCKKILVLTGAGVRSLILISLTV